MHFALNIDPAIKQGQTRYHYLVRNYMLLKWGSEYQTSCIVNRCLIMEWSAIQMKNHLNMVLVIDLPNMDLPGQRRH